MTCADLAVEDLDREGIGAADLVAFYVPMHTATRLALPLIKEVRRANPAAHICCYGLYAPVNQDHLRRVGANTILGGEFEEGLLSLCRRLIQDGDPSVSQHEPLISLSRQRFLVPDRRGLPALSSYARLITGDGEERTVGYVEASRGCKHLCRHCPVVPVYEGKFRIVQQDIVLEDIRQQVAAGARHITFGDPDFFNGIGHALPIVRSLHAEYPDLTYDVTIKVEHLLKHLEHLPALHDTGCALVTSAVESIDDRVLAILDKGHTREDFIGIVRTFRDIGLTLNPTFVTFTPWTTLESYRSLLGLLVDLNLVDSVAPVQLAIRLLIPAGSKLLELPEVRGLVGAFEEERLSYSWTHGDPRVDHLYREATALVWESHANGAARREIFQAFWSLAHSALGRSEHLPESFFSPAGPPVPYITEPWYCCAEPTEDQYAVA